MKIFLHATLKKERILEEALGEHHGKRMTSAIAPGYLETAISYKNDSWPTMLASSPTSYVKGDIINVTPAEMDKLKAWENHYQPREVKTSDGPAQAFFFRKDPV